MIFGYAEKQLDPAHGMLQMREVSFEMTPEQLRQVARFLQSAASDLEAGTFEGSHRHLQSAGNNWAGSSDVIVLRPGDVG